MRGFETDFSALKDGVKYELRLKTGYIYNRCFWRADSNRFERGKGIVSVIELKKVDGYRIDTDPFDS